MPTNRLVALAGEVLCPSCGRELTPKIVGGVGGFKALGMVLQSFASEEHFSVEFVLPAPKEADDL